MKKILVTIFLLLLAFNANAFETKAPYAILIDANSGNELYCKEADTPIPPSSMSKLMTVYVVFEKLKDGTVKLDDEFTVSEKAWKQGGSKMFVQVGDKVRVEDLLKGIIIQSGNDACITIAENIMGSEEAFAEVMNQKGKELGLQNSRFMNSNGWPIAGHEMSVRDLAKLSHALINKFPEYYNLFSMKEFTYNNITQGNRNELLTSNPYADGLKTGHTDAGGYGLAASAQKDGRRVIAVVNGLKNTKDRKIEADSLIRYGLMNFENVTFAKTDEPVIMADVAGGSKKQTGLVAKETIIMTLPKATSRTAEAKIIYNSPLAAPLKKGDVVAKLEVKYDNDKVATHDLVAMEDNPKLGFFGRVLRRIGV